LTFEQRIKPINIHAQAGKDFAELLRMAKSETCEIWHAGREDRVEILSHIYDPFSQTHIFQARLVRGSRSEIPGSKGKAMHEEK